MTHTPKANFFLIGAAKAGTTSLDRLLRAHPQAYLSPIKEPCHFCSDINDQIRPEATRQAVIKLDKYLDAGCTDIIHQHLVERPEDYDRLFSAAPPETKIIGECSTYYMVSEVAPDRVHAYNPDARIVVMLRDPFERIRSHYEMDVRTGLERRRLDQCLDAELALGTKANYGNCRYYLGASDYAKQVARWVKVFGREQVLVIDFAAFISDPDNQMRRLYAFLGIDADRPAVPLSHENRGDWAPIYPRLDAFLYRTGVKQHLRSIAKKLLGKQVFGRLKKFYIGSNKAPKTDRPFDGILERVEIVDLQNNYHNLVSEYGHRARPT